MSDHQMGVTTGLAVHVINSLITAPWLKIGVISLQTHLLDMIKDIIDLNNIQINLNNVEKPKSDTKYDIQAQGINTIYSNYKLYHLGQYPLISGYCFENVI